MSDTAKQEDALQPILDKFLPVFKDLVSSHDFRLVAAVLLQEGAVLLQSGISASVITPEYGQRLLDAAREQMLEPREKKATVRFSHEGTIGSKH